MENKPSVSCRRMAYSVDHNVIREAEDKEDAVSEADQDELEWAERNQAAVHSDFTAKKV